MLKIVFVAAAALVDQNNRVLIARRPAGKQLAGLWEFPGGKVEAGEAPESALIRELHEELGITVALDALQPLTFASHAYPGFHLFMPLWLVRSWAGDIIANEHDGLIWTHPQELVNFEMPPADLPLIPPLVAALSQAPGG